MRGAALAWWFIAVCHLSAVAQPSSAVDEEYSRFATFEIRKGWRSKGLKARFRYRTVCLSPLAAEDRVRHIYERGDTRVKDVRASYGGDELPKERIHSSAADDGDVFIGNDRYYTLAFPATLKVGDTLEYAYTVEFDDIARLPMQFVPNRNRVREYQIDVTHPDFMSIRFDCYFPRDSIPVAVTQTDSKHTVLRIADLTYMPPLPHFPYNDAQAYILITAVQDGKRLQPTTVGDFVQWYGGRTNLRPRLDLSAASPAVLEGIDTLSPLATLARIHAFVRDSVRYIGDARPGHRLIPYEPSVILERRYGDCKDRAALVAALAARAGLRVSLALVSTIPSPRFAGVHISEFNHVICAYNDNGRHVFFDPTAPSFPFGELPPNLIGQRALILDTEAPRLRDVTASGSPSPVSVKIAAHVDSLQTAGAEITLRGSYHAAARHLRQTESDGALARALASLAEMPFPRLSFNDVEFAGEEPGVTRLTARADLRHWAVGSPERIYLPRAPVSGVDRDLVARGDDHWAVYFDEPADAALELILRAPGFVVDADSTALGASGATRFHAAARQTDSQTVELRYCLRRPAGTFDGAQKDSLVAFADAYLASKSNLFILTRKP